MKIRGVRCKTGIKMECACVWRAYEVYHYIMYMHIDHMARGHECMQLYLLVLILWSGNCLQCQLFLVIRLRCVCAVRAPIAS